MVNVGNVAAFQALMRAHNNALKKRQRAYAAAGPNVMAPCMGNMCLNFRQPNRTPNQQRLRDNAHRANREYNNAYRRLKNALGQAMWVNNNNNVFTAERPPNHMRPTTNAAWNLGARGHAIRAATTIQRHTRGGQQRSRTGLHNPHTAPGRRFLLSRFFGPKGNPAAARIQRAYRRHRARR